MSRQEPYLKTRSIRNLPDDPRFIEGIYNYCWYQFQIAVKIMRGLMRDDPEEAGEPEAVRQSDSDGSVKVALIGMKRSISAWGKLQELLPEKTAGILPMLLHLEQLRRRTGQSFPKAQSFVRPDFDEAPD